MKTLTFHAAGASYRARVIKSQATVGSVAARLAARVGMRGSFSMVDKKGKLLDPETKLGDLEQGDVTLSSELTPAVV